MVGFGRFQDPGCVLSCTEEVPNQRIIQSTPKFRALNALGRQEEAFPTTKSSIAAGVPVLEVRSFDTHQK